MSSIPELISLKKYPTNMDVTDGAVQSSASPLANQIPFEPQVSTVSASSMQGPPEKRKVYFNKRHWHRYKGNSISTAKYNVATFFPKFLFEQFRRYANIFFLMIAGLQQIPDVSPTGRWTTLIPLTFILAVSAVKEVFEDTKRRIADTSVNWKKAKVIKSIGLANSRWYELKVGEVVKLKNGEQIPADMILISSSEPQNIAYIETSNLDGETNLKIRQASTKTWEYDDVDNISSLNGWIECETPNRHLYEFQGVLNVEKGRENIVSSLGPDQMLLRGARLLNTEWTYGIVVYAGHDTKVMMNSLNSVPLKRSSMDRLVNTQILFIFCILLLICVFSSIGMAIWNSNNAAADAYITPGVLSGFNVASSLLTFVILYNNLIPISLQVTLELVRFFQAYFIGWDKDMYHAETKQYAIARTSTLNEELGQVQYIFTDKTGTLTENNMLFRACSIAGELYGLKLADDGKANSPSRSQFNEDSLRRAVSEANESNLFFNEESRTLKNYITALAVCHTVLPERDENSDIPIYLASSPDELALVNAAASVGYVALSRTPDMLSVRIDGQQELAQFEILNILEFTSERKRMSVICRDSFGKIKLFSKGADSVICERLAPNQKYVDVTMHHLEEFAAFGYRTLCIAMKELSEDEYEQWNSNIWSAASCDIFDRKAKVAQAAEMIEQNLHLLGATAIEDKLQESVPETIAALMKANIKIWILTGDHQATAINIGHSSKLIGRETPLIILNERTLDDIRGSIETHRTTIEGELHHNPSKEWALVIDGQALVYALMDETRREFYALATRCKAVICCRFSPMQKAEVVKMVRHFTTRSGWFQQELTHCTTLAIGDGANDVAMIQAAHIGVGISGKEGMAAVCASDFAIGQFSFLKKLLFVHGAWCHERIAKLILYSFYKNICLYLMQFWFALTSAYSGQTLFERWTIGLYNVFFTAAPPFALGLFDRTCSLDSRMKYPLLYRLSQLGYLFNIRIFWLWVAKAVGHAILLYLMTYGAVQTGVLWSGGESSGTVAFGTITMTVTIITVCVKAGLETNAWSWPTHVALWGSIMNWFVFLFIYSNLWPKFNIADDMVQMDVALVSSPVFWFVLAFIPCVALIFDVAAKTVHNTFYPALTTAVRAMEIAGAEDIGAFLRHQKQDFAQHDEEMANQINTEQAVLIDRFEARPIAAKNKNPSPNSRHYKHGYAFSQDENGALGQSDYVSAYRPRGYGSMDSLHHTLSDVPDSEWFSHQRHKSLDAGNLAERRRPKTG